MNSAIKDFLLGVDTKHSNYNSAILLFSRFASGLLILPFGWSKLQDYENLSQNFFDNIIGIGDEPALLLCIFAQLICPFFLMTGFLTRIAGFFLFFHMIPATGYHFTDPIGKVGFPLAFLLIYFILMMSGPGKYSLDNILFGKNNKQPIYPYQWAGVIILTLSFILAWFVFGNAFSSTISWVLLVVLFLSWLLSLRLLK